MSPFELRVIVCAERAAGQVAPPPVASAPAWSNVVSAPPLRTPGGGPSRRQILLPISRAHSSAVGRWRLDCSETESRRRPEMPTASTSGSLCDMNVAVPWTTSCRRFPPKTSIVPDSPLNPPRGPSVVETLLQRALASTRTAA
eukprot:scaffold79236_cov32-Tisochrysis_lutea.AAC.8